MLGSGCTTIGATVATHQLVYWLRRSRGPKQGQPARGGGPGWPPASSGRAPRWRLPSWRRPAAPLPGALPAPRTRPPAVAIRVRGHPCSGILTRHPDPDTWAPETWAPKMTMCSCSSWAHLEGAGAGAPASGLPTRRRLLGHLQRRPPPQRPWHHVAPGHLGAGPASGDPDCPHCSGLYAWSQMQVDSAGSRHSTPAPNTFTTQPQNIREAFNRGSKMGWLSRCSYLVGQLVGQLVRGVCGVCGGGCRAQGGGAKGAAAPQRGGPPRLPTLAAQLQRLCNPPCSMEMSRPGQTTKACKKGMDVAHKEAVGCGC